MRRIAWRVLAALALASVAQTAGLAGPKTTVAYDEGASSEVSALRTEIDALRTEIQASMTTSHEDPQPTPAADAGTLDFEVFDTSGPNRNWDLEIAAGIRYNKCRETMIDADDYRRNEFTGYGIVASAELRRLIGCNSALFVRTRASILMSDK